MNIDGVDIPKEPYHPKTVVEKADKYDLIVKALWALSRTGSVLHSVLASNLIIELGIGGPNGESPCDS